MQTNTTKTAAASSFAKALKSSIELDLIDADELAPLAALMFERIHSSRHEPSAVAHHDAREGVVRHINDALAAFHAIR